jgi:hypothetical protein
MSHKPLNPKKSPNPDILEVSTEQKVEMVFGQPPFYPDLKDFKPQSQVRTPNVLAISPILLEFLLLISSQSETQLTRTKVKPDSILCETAILL